MPPARGRGLDVLRGRPRGQDDLLVQLSAKYIVTGRKSAHGLTGEIKTNDEHTRGNKSLKEKKRSGGESKKRITRIHTHVSQDSFIYTEDLLVLCCDYFLFLVSLHAFSYVIYVYMSPLPLQGPKLFRTNTKPHHSVCVSHWLGCSGGRSLAIPLVGLVRGGG